MERHTHVGSTKDKRIEREIGVTMGRKRKETKSEVNKK
jgi:hypothetical protein